MRYFISLGRRIYTLWSKLRTRFAERPRSSPAIPNSYTAINRQTEDGEFELKLSSGRLPQDLAGSLFFAQCLGSPGAYMVGDTNILRLDFNTQGVSQKNRKLRTPAAIAREKLADSRYRFDFLGLMYLSPGLGLLSYTEGMYLLEDGRIAVTSDIDRPWVIDPVSLKAQTPIGQREDWLPLMEGNVGRMLGELFPGVNGSHSFQLDRQTGEHFLVNFQLRQVSGRHPLRVLRWMGEGDIESWKVVDQAGREIEIRQSVHELVFTRDYIVIVDTAFLANPEMLQPWKRAPMPSQYSDVYLLRRDALLREKGSVIADHVRIKKPCIHLLAEYENAKNEVTLYMLHTPGTNTAELIKSGDSDLDGKLYPANLIGYGPLPPLALSSLGKHVISTSEGKVLHSEYIEEESQSWAPYLYAYSGRQFRHFAGQDLYVMFKGFSSDLIPRRIMRAYGKHKQQKLAATPQINPSIRKISCQPFEIRKSLVFPDGVYLYSFAHLDSNQKDHPGYLLAAVATDEPDSAESAGHEYWLYDAQDLSSEPLAKLIHPKVHHATLFHSVFVPQEKMREYSPTPNAYRVSLRADYSLDELDKWGREVIDLFRKHIWPYFD